MIGTIKKMIMPMAFFAAAAIVFWSASPASVSAFQDAKTLYGQKCASCHGVDGSGNTPTGKKMKLKDLRSPEVQKMTDDKLLAVISKGAGKMPGYEKSLGADNCKKLVGYMRELAKKK